MTSARPVSLPDSLAPGCAFFDYDNDRDEDILLVNSSAWPQSLNGDAPSRLPVVGLYANDGSGLYRDVTAGSGLDVSFRAMGVAAGDYDNDGLRDLFITGVNECRLWHNEGSGRFRDVTRPAGLPGPGNRWATSAAWVDHDNDGLLDLLVCDYGEWDGGKQTAGGGLSLYRNTGEGKFRDVSVAAGVRTTDARLQTRCLALGPVDLNDDGWIDVIVSNDGGPNFVFRNRRDGTFAECGSACGLAYDSLGNEQHSRGVDTAWWRDDPSLHVAIAAARGEGLKIYARRKHPQQFVDEAPGYGIARLTRPRSTYGAVFLDYDLDGWADMLTVGGSVEEPESSQLFWNQGQDLDLAFHAVRGSESGNSLFMPLAGRSVAYADIDGDNDLDVLITQNGARPVMLRNDQQTANASLRVRLVGSRSARDAVGARITLHSGNHFWRAQMTPTRGYLSQSELAITFGLGQTEAQRDLEIRWPSGYVQKLRVKSSERTLTVVEPLKTGFADNEP